ncbi:MAG: c-type cytochrome [Parvibaculum sp.]
MSEIRGDKVGIIQISTKLIRVGPLLAASLLLASCGEPAETPEHRAALITAAETASPADPVLAEKYERACKACHADPENAAPLTGDKRAWIGRVNDRGRSGLLQSSINGFGGMPPLGACIDCSADDLDQLITFMMGK